MAPAPSVERIRELFSPWETGDGIKAVEMEVEKMFQVPETIAIARIFRAAEGGWVSISVASKNGSLLLKGKPYNQTYLWATKWDGEHIVEVEEYADFELLADAAAAYLQIRGAHLRIRDIVEFHERSTAT
ncbi:hypothetical protein ASPFODRAFT_212127 [Aspergillus luchuensis CBS 106.47]|uniref:SnoaL-like domain-containing protein n=1 Tax=Aspergillus luchuensis (strain CBS 106.47) TaxID=1137211 RepID=A0A1M3T282_ASPLC|nr:hypothetical protein ASPFODRAFT_212127 [Aspergillus luchuensis CBS 106.47]